MTTEDAIDSLRHYADHGRPVGGFLTAVLSNDLMDAMSRADDTSRANLYDICMYVYNELPSGCWGSDAKVRNWLGAHAAARIAIAAEQKHVQD